MLLLKSDFSFFYYWHNVCVGLPGWADVQCVVA